MLTNQCQCELRNLAQGGPSRNRSCETNNAAFPRTAKALAVELADSLVRLRKQYEIAEVARSTQRGWFQAMLNAAPQADDMIRSGSASTAANYVRILSNREPEQELWKREDIIRMQLDADCVSQQELAFLQLGEKINGLISYSDGRVYEHDHDPSTRSDAEDDDIVGCPLDPLLEKYYDKAGDVRILGERLVDLDLDHQADMISRNLRLDQSYGNEVLDQAFEGQYIADRRKLEDALDAAIAEADDLKDQCLAANLNIETANDSQASAQSIDGVAENATESEQLTQLRQSLEHRIDTTQLYPGIDIEHISADRQNNKTPPPRINTAKVSEWVQSVPNVSASSNLPVPSYTQNRSRSFSSGDVTADRNTADYFSSNRSENTSHRSSFPQSSMFTGQSMDGWEDRPSALNMSPVLVQNP